MPEAIGLILHKTLQVTVILCAVGLLFSHLLVVKKNPDENELAASHESIAGRNERSTPRSFVLPATPGVAFEQEAQKQDEARQAQIANCVGALRALGYQLPDNKTFLNAKLVEAVYSYQQAHNLRPTGRLDESTMGMLKCA